MKETRLNKKTLQQFKDMSAKTAFELIYEKQYWGSADGHPYYSGSGSHDVAIVAPYIKSMKNWLKSLDKNIHLVDLGCGDFSVGNQLLTETNSYGACDVSCSLIDFNKTKFESEKLKFYCLDAIEDKLPKGNVLVIRQVFQHLANNDIEKIIRKFNDFEYVVITEHIPEKEFIANKDKSIGPDSRLRIKSGVDVTKSPFNYQCESEVVLCEVKDNSGFGGVIKTVLYK